MNRLGTTWTFATENFLMLVVIFILAPSMLSVADTPGTMVAAIILLLMFAAKFYFAIKLRILRFDEHGIVMLNMFWDKEMLEYQDIISVSLVKLNLPLGRLNYAAARLQYVKHGKKRFVYISANDPGQWKLFAEEVRSQAGIEIK